MRHQPLLAGKGYGEEIPGYRLEDQSANSERINQPNGDPRDVLFDTKNGEHHVTQQIARLAVTDILSLEFPNAKSIRFAKDGKTPLNEPDKFTFEILHKPAPCMYPHCIIKAKKNGQDLKRVAEGVRTEIRSEVAMLAERHRQEMLQYFNTGLPKEEEPRFYGLRRVGAGAVALVGIYVGYRLLRMIFAH